MKRLSRVFLAVGLSLLFVNALWGQGFSVQLVASDGVSTDTLTIGTASGATAGIDAAQGEVELPPTPPAGIFDARLIGIPSNPNSMGQGLSIDMRGFSSATQTDTFKVKWQTQGAPDASDDLTLSWPAGLSAVAGGYWHLVLPGGPVIDMTASTGTTVSSDYPTFTIINGNANAYTTFTYQRFWQDLNYKGQMFKSNKKDKAVFYWPNVANLGEEMSADKPSLPLVTAGSVTGRRVLLAKYGDIYKAAYAKTFTHSPDSISCLDYFPHTAKGKSWPGSVAPDAKNTGKMALKDLKKFDPTPLKGINSYLFAQLMTLKFNLKASSMGKTPTGLGSLIINDGSAFAGMTISELATVGDQAFSCVDVSATGTLQEITDELEAVNKAFNKSAVAGYPADTAHCDTLNGTPWRISGVVSGKPVLTAKLTLKLGGWIPLAQVSWLSAPASAPVNQHASVVENAQPEQYRLEQNYPNPFNPSTTIKFNLVNEGLVTVKVFNLLGQEVGSVLNGEEMTAGENEVSFDASSLASGVYLYRIQVNDAVSGKVMFQEMKKMMLVK